MNEHCVRVVISAHGEQQVQLRLGSAASERPLVVQVATRGSPTRARAEDSADAIANRTTLGASTISLELRWSAPVQVPVPKPEEPRSEPAPLATAWALGQLLRKEYSTNPAPRRRSSRSRGR
jgi:hypothetical protein